MRLTSVFLLLAALMLAAAAFSQTEALLPGSETALRTFLASWFMAPEDLLGPAVFIGTLGLASLLADVLRLLVGKPRRAAARSRREEVIVDGSNVMYWQGDTPRLDTLTSVLRRPEAEGLDPAVIFDASAGWRLEGRWLGDAALARRLGLARERVQVVHKGTVADEVILAAARRCKARIVTNDRYRDWAEAWPEARDPARFIRGEWREAGLRLFGIGADHAAGSPLQAAA